MLHLELQPEVEARLLAQAQSRGVAVNDYVASMIRNIDDLDAATEESEADIAAGRGRPAEEFFEEQEERFPVDLAEAAAAAACIRELRQDCVLAPYTIKELINEGRRY